MSVPQNIQELANKVRNEIYGRDVRESIAKSMEATGEVAEWSRQVAQDIVDGKFDEGELATEIERKLNDLEVQYAPELNQVKTDLAQTATLSEQLQVKNQIDYVSDLQKMASAKRKMSFEKLPSSRERFKINVPLSDGDGIGYYFQRNPNDDFVMLLQGEYGEIVRDYILAERINYQEYFLGDVVGTGGDADHNTNPPNYWTNRVDEAYIQAKDLYGTKITFNHYAESRGGIWEFTLNEGTAYEQTTTISTYASTTTTKETTLFENLDLRNHTIKGVFKGADPQNPPSSGSARGWVYYGGERPQDTSRTFHVYRDTFSVSDNIPALYSYSNKEFAVRLRPIGSTDPHRYIPEHESLGTAFNKVDRKLLLDGEEVDLDTLDYADEFETMQLVQIIYGYYPTDLNNPMIEVHCQHTIKDGVVSVNGKIKFLQKADVQSLSSILTPYYVNFVDKVKTSLGNIYETKTDGSHEYWIESDKFKSLAFINENSDVILATTIDNLDRTYRYGEDGRGDPFSWLRHQSSKLGKTYYRHVQDYEVEEGFEYSYDGRFIVTKIPGIVDYIL